MFMAEEHELADAAVWPITARPDGHGDVVVGGLGLAELARRYGTPLHILDEADVRRRCRDFRSAFPDGEVVYAAKAFLCKAMAGWIDEEGLSLDVCSAGELAVARAVGFPPDRILMHGNAKTPHDLSAALAYGVDRIVVDSVGEISRLAALAGTAAERRRIMIRVTPGIDGHTHPALATGIEDQKFGFSLSSGAAADAVRRVLKQRGLILAGLHCHLGSQISEIEPFEEAARRMVQFLAAIRDEHDVLPGHLDLGGGFAVPYRPDDPALDPADLAARLTKVLRDECDAHRLPLPKIGIEPGRAISARAGVTLYRVIGLKHSSPSGLKRSSSSRLNLNSSSRLELSSTARPDHSSTSRLFVTVNGGMSDNPRPALYGSRYTARLIGRRATAADRTVTVAGRHCEAGDILVPDAILPADLRPGDLLAIPCTGAYHHSMGSNYNLVPRPPVVAVHEGTSRILIRRETEHDLLRRDIGR